MRHPGNPPQPPCVVSFFSGLRFIPAIPGSADLPRSLSSSVRASGRPGVREPARMLSDRCQTAVGMPPEYCLKAVRMLPAPCRMLPAASEPPPELGRRFCDRVREFAAELRLWGFAVRIPELAMEIPAVRFLSAVIAACGFGPAVPAPRPLPAIPQRVISSKRCPKSSPARACRRRSPAPARRQRSSGRRR